VIGHAAAALPTSLMNSRRLIATPEAQKQDIVTTQTGKLEGVGGGGSNCPLWVISGHFRRSSRCPLYPQ
jgi:hypothetical protein